MKGDVGDVGIRTDIKLGAINQMLIAMIVAIHRAGGAFTVTRAEYEAACRELGVLPGAHADLSWSQDDTSLTVSLFPAAKATTRPQ